MLCDIACRPQIHDELPAVVFVIIRGPLNRGDGAVEKGFSVLGHIPTPVFTVFATAFEIVSAIGLQRALPDSRMVAIGNGFMTERS